MPNEIKLGKNTRMSYSKITEASEMPNLIEVQKNSYEWFLTDGLLEVLKDVSPITNFSSRDDQEKSCKWFLSDEMFGSVFSKPQIDDMADKLVLEFIDFTLERENTKYTLEECRERDATYAAPLKVRVRLINKDTGEVKEQEIFMGDFPLMTDQGTFVYNGAERVIVSQLVKSPGIYYASSFDKAGNKLFTSTVIPNRGAWIEYETDQYNVFSVRVDRTRKLPVTVLLKAFGLSSADEITDMFGEEDILLNTLSKDTTKNTQEALEEIYKRLRPGEPATLEGAAKLLGSLFFDAKRYDLARVGRYKFNKKLALSDRVLGKTLNEDVVSPVTGEILFSKGDVLNKEACLTLEKNAVNRVVLDINGDSVIVFSNGMVDAKHFLDFNPEEVGINENVRFDLLTKLIEDANGDTQELKTSLIENAENLMPKHVMVEDVFASVNYVLNMRHGIGETDNIDHLGNRRLRAVGELLQNQFRLGFSRMERVVRERMTIQDLDVITPQALINTRPVVAAVKEFFGSSQLSQFMDQPNPLAELTHKRRLSALGPGGLSRDRASFDVRDVHYSHYGRMCPIETPEGPNIGLINSLATYARINNYGFIEAPYRVVKDGAVTDEIVYITADIEDGKIIAQATEPCDENGKFIAKKIIARKQDDMIEVTPDRIDYMDVSPRQVVSVATAMIPFLENDDASRALMGSNMQRQAVPLIKPESPIIGTGMEYRAAMDSGVVVVAKNDCTVLKVAADKVVVREEETGEIRTYNILKFTRSNQGTCINQRPVVKEGDFVKKGELIADGPATENGEVGLGKNVLIGFMTWEGYNYEDAILLNENLVKDDVLTSIHIEEYEIDSRDTKLGAEEITRDIPNVGDDALRDLDERGIVRIGAEVHAGDILVGKVTPKGETELTAEERLLRAIFGEKAREVRDTSLRVPHGESGIIVDVKVFTRENGDELNPGVNQVIRCYIAQKRKISVGDKMAGRHGNKGVVSRVLPQEDMPFLPDGTPLQIVLNPLGVPSRMNIGQVLEVHLGYAAKALGWKIATPVFDGAHEEDIKEALKLAKQVETDKENGTPELYDETGKITLYDGRTGQKFDNPVTVGYMYMLKLHHLVDDKIHARSTGPYSLVTQQPLGGKAQFGGQRFGEMEVWALEAYGAAYTLQEILTIKSDDIVGRVKTYESIVKGLNVPKPGVPESFKVLIKELQSLCLDVKVLDKDDNEIDLREYDEDIEAPEATPEILAEIRKSAERAQEEALANGEAKADAVDDDFTLEEEMVYDGEFDNVVDFEDING
ncbi:MAG: DNA-directed RNA polymerase subunit beta [Clostridia bacterium]|nr:DNA-directed RNA polymerase subunit beta [Clostridia bacterium]